MSARLHQIPVTLQTGTSSGRTISAGGRQPAALTRRHAGSTARAPA